MEKTDKTKKIKKIVLVVVICLAAVVLALSSFVTVPAGHSGVVLTLGAVQDNVLAAGLHMKVPFAQSVVTVDNRTQKTEAEGSASSKDLQIVTYSVAVNYTVLSSASANLYKTVGVNYESIVVAPAIQESIKAVTAQYTAEDLIVKRQEVGDRIKDALSEKISPYGINVEIFNITNFEFTEEFNKAVEAKQTAQQNALKAEQDLSRIKIEAQQKIEQAKAEAESIKMIQETLKTSPDYIDYIKWSKWDGKLPNVMSDGSMIFDSSVVNGNGGNSTQPTETGE